MSELSNGLGGTAPKHTLTVGDKTYMVGLIDLNAKVWFEKALYARAIEACSRLRDKIDKEDYNARMFELSDMYDRGEFKFGAERAMKMLGTPAGMVMMLSHLMETNEHELFNLMLEDEAKITGMLKTVMRESFPAAAKKMDFDDEKGEDSDPKAPPG